MFLVNWVIICFVFFAGQNLGLVELPQVDDNNIFTTEAVIRSTINTLFYKLGLRGIKTKPRLREYTTVHNHLVSFTLQDYTNLKEIAKLTRVDKTKINNDTQSFMTVINELLNDDVVDDRKEATIADAKDESVINYIDNFLTTLETLKEEYGVNKENYRIKDDVFKILKDDQLSHNFTMDDSYKSDSEENDTFTDGSNFWKPDVSGRRIYRGDRTKIKYFPFMASIQMFNTFHCAGSIIKSDLIITASSCLQLAWNNRFFRENPAFLSVRVGSNFYNGGGENIPVLEVYFHPQYNPKNLWNNICLLRLVRHLKFKRKSKGKNLKKIEFDTNPTQLPLTADGVTIVGWGAKGTNNIVHNPWENILSFAVLDIYPLWECEEIYSREYVTKKNFCAGFFSKGGGACNRDVGGPGVVNGILMGVVSFGSPICGTPDAPTVFTKIGHYSDWIEEIMEQNVHTINHRTTLKPEFVFTPPQYYRPIKTTFKIPPLSGKNIQPIPIKDVDALRMLKNEELFREFLGTVFGSDNAGQYQELLKDLYNSNEEVVELNEDIPLDQPLERVREAQVTTPIQPTIEELNEGPDQAVTEIGIVEPDYVTTSDDNVIESTSSDPSIIRVDERKDLENDIFKLIDDIDLKEIMDGVPSVEEDKLLNDVKIDDIPLKSEPENKVLQMDDSTLTLLYLSDTEKGAKANVNVNNNQELVVKEFEESSDDDGETEGLSIPVDNFKDLTYRNSNKSGGLQDTIPANEMYYLISEAMNTDAKKETVK